MSNDWIKWLGGNNPLAKVPEVRVDVIQRDGRAMSDLASAFGWLHMNHPGDIVSYRVSEQQSPQMVKTNPADSGKPCLCFPGQCRGQVIDGKQPNGDRCKAEFAESDEAWFEWDVRTLPTSPLLAPNMKMEWELGNGHKAVGEARDPCWTLPADSPYRVTRYRWIDPRVMVLNPYTGKKRHAVDIMQDPEGRSVVPPAWVHEAIPAEHEAAWREVGEAMRSLDASGQMPTVEIVNDPAKIEAAFEHDQEAEDSVTLRLPGDVANCLKATAEATGQSLDDVVGEALRRDIEASFKSKVTEISISNDIDLRELDLSKMQLQPGTIVHISADESRVFGMDEAYDYVTIDAQFNDFMQGFGAGEDHDDMRKSLLSLGLAEGTVSKMMMALAHSETKEKRVEATAAMSTLFRMGYTYTHGAELWKPPIGKAPAFSAPDLLDVAAGHMRDRAATYDKPEGERSMGATVQAFNAITGRDLRESEGWLLMTLLKMVRSETRDSPHRDSVEDLIAYAGLYGEARLGGV
jgi:hypothetical protein